MYDISVGLDILEVDVVALTVCAKFFLRNSLYTATPDSLNFAGSTHTEPEVMPRGFEPFAKRRLKSDWLCAAFRGHSPALKIPIADMDAKRFA